MRIRDKIDKFLFDLDIDDPGYIDTLSDYDVNEIPEVKELLKGRKIVNFFVIRDKDTIGLAGSEKPDIDGNRLLGFDYTLKIL